MERLRSWWDETVNWWKGQKVEWYAGYGTAIYVGIIVMVMAAKLDELFSLKLNEIGDFLAGAFGPVAFLWLILGYIQQGRELKLSSEALQRQAAELKSSVEQQSIMATAATDQLKSQQAAFDLQVWRHQQDISPEFEVNIFRLGLQGLNPLSRSVIRVKNSGHAVRLVTVEFDELWGVEGALHCGDLKSGKSSGDIGFDHVAPPDNFNGYFFIDYLRIDGKFYRDRFSYVYFVPGGEFKLISLGREPVQ